MIQDRASGDNCQTKARMERLEKRSPVNTECVFSAWVEPNVEKMDVQNISCVFKRIVEINALNALSNMGDKRFSFTTTKILDINLGFKRPWSESIGKATRPFSVCTMPHELLDSCQFCNYTKKNSTFHYTEQNHPNADVCAWNVCMNHHSGMCSADDINLTMSSCDTTNTVRCCTPLARPMFANLAHNQDLRSHNRNLTTSSRSWAQVNTDLSIKEPTRRRSITGPLYRETTRIPGYFQAFKHHKCTAQYMDQYRDNYTYRKLLDARDPRLSQDRSFICSCGNVKCAGFITTTGGTQRWYSNQSHNVRAAKASDFRSTTVNKQPDLAESRSIPSRQASSVSLQVLPRNKSKSPTKVVSVPHDASTFPSLQVSSYLRGGTLTETGAKTAVIQSAHATHNVFGAHKTKVASPSFNVGGNRTGKWK